jgi:hypothetical protein
MPRTDGGKISFDQAVSRYIQARNNAAVLGQDTGAPPVMETGRRLIIFDSWTKSKNVNITLFSATLGYLLQKLRNILEIT